MTRQGAPVMIAGVVLIVLGSIAMVTGTGLILLGLVAGPPPSEGFWLGPGSLYLAFGIVAGVLGLAGLVAGVGVWGGRTWGRALGVLLAGLGGLVTVPVIIGRGIAPDTLAGVLVAGYVLAALLLGWRTSPASPIDRGRDGSSPPGPPVS